ncbi:MAG: hypothetical protein WAW53_03175 [Candidatus Dormiibacterota bacterium]
MSGRLSKSRQEPLGPDETFSALVTRLIITNRVERATREKISPTLSTVPDALGDGLREPRSRIEAES